MELRAQQVKAEPEFYWVGLTDNTKVFIPVNASDSDESKYQNFLKVKAESADEAMHIVITKLLVNEYRIIVDRLWAWR